MLWPSASHYCYSRKLEEERVDLPAFYSLICYSCIEWNGCNHCYSAAGFESKSQCLACTGDGRLKFCKNMLKDNYYEAQLLEEKRSMISKGCFFCYN